MFNNGIDVLQYEWIWITAKITFIQKMSQNMYLVFTSCFMVSLVLYYKPEKGFSSVIHHQTTWEDNE